MNELKPNEAGLAKKVHVETWGCQMNVADSERMLGILQAENYTLSDSAEDADLVLLNTCHIREKAKHKVLSRLGRLRQMKDKNPGMRIAVAGCVAQAEGQKLIDQAGVIDILFGPGKIDDLPALLRQNRETQKPALSIGFRKGPEEQEAKEQSDAPVHAPVTSAAPSLTGANSVSRFVNIQQGCDNFCTFCVVPFTRGREISRQPQEIVNEAKQLIAAGAKEITLLGQNVNSYGLDLVEQNALASSERGPFVELLAKVADEVKGMARLRFTTSNPHDFSEHLASLFAEKNVLGRYIHLPVQSGDDEVLLRMRRKVTVAEYLSRVDWLRAVDPTMALSTDIIVGFPGETEEQFANTLALVEKVQFSFIYCFKYSPRRGTAAARFRDQVAEEVKDQRLARLNELQDRITTAANQQEVGQQREVLFQYESKKEPGVFYGRTPHFRLVRCRSQRDLVGQLATVQIESANKIALEGQLV